MPILGIDEVGRGPWAGPLVVGAVILNHPIDSKEQLLENSDGLINSNPSDNPIWDKLTDSKKLTKNAREKLEPQIKQYAFSTGLGWVSAEEIDELGLSESLRLAAKKAVLECLKNAGIGKPEQYVGSNKNVAFEPDFPVNEIIIDGTQNFLRGTPLEDKVSILKKADLLIKEVSAASIIAKVARDNYMSETLAKQYPGYGFEKHMGYGTAVHKKALEMLGPCPEHRASFKPVAEIIKTISGDQEKAAHLKNPKTRQTSTDIGRRAERVVADYLKEQGHKIMVMNYKTKFYEIDIISATNEKIYFTEVKYRKDHSHGTPLEAITKQKEQQMKFAAEAFMKYLSRKLGRTENNLPRPALAAAAVSGDDFELEKWLPLV